MKYIITFLFFISAAHAIAQVTCRENVMTTNRFCISQTERVGNNFYFFATNDTGSEAKMLFNFGGLISASRPDGIMVKLDDGMPFKVTASSTRPDVNCRRNRVCTWSVGAVANITGAQFSQIGTSSRMLVSFTEGAYVSEPIEVNPKIISSWFQQWVALTK